MIKSAIDIPSNALRYTAKTVWNLLPDKTTQAVKNFVDNRSWVTRSLVKASTSGAILGGAWLTGAGVLGLGAAAAGTCIVGRATRITHLKTGQNLPKNPDLTLRKTARTIVKLAARSNEPRALLLPFANAPEPRPVPPFVDVAAQVRKTDRCLQTFIQNASVAATISFIHYGRLGLEIDPTILPKIVLEASAEGAKLWDIYMKYLGENLTGCQKFCACFWYILTYTLGIIPNSIKTFMTNVLKEGREHFNHPTSIHPLDRPIRNILDKMSSLLEVYNSATREYARAEVPTGDVDSYRKAALESFSGKSLENLTEEFCTTLVDQFFPHIPFFETLKQYPIIGWVFWILDYLIGGLINCVGRKVLKSKLPGIAQDLIKTGIDSTNQTNLQFSIAITNSITELFKDVENTPLTNEAPPFRPAKLPLVIEKLLETLALNGSRDNPLNTQQKIQKRVAKLDRNSWLHVFGVWLRTKKRDHLRNAMVDSSHAFIAHIGNNSEQLFASVLELLNIPFTETVLRTPEDYKNAFEELERTAQNGFNKVIYNSLEGNSLAYQRELYEGLYNKYKQTTDAAVRGLTTCQERILTPGNTPDELMQRIDQYAGALKKCTEHPVIKKAHLAGSAVEQAFYESFYPFQKALPPLARQLSRLQKLVKQHQLDLKITDHLGRIDEALDRISQNPEHHFSTERLTTVRRSLNYIHEALPQQPMEQINVENAALERHLNAIDTRRRTIERLRRLAEDETLCDRLVSNPGLTKSQIHGNLAAHELLILQPLIQQVRRGILFNNAKAALMGEINRLLQENRQLYAQTTEQLRTTVRALTQNIAPINANQAAKNQQYQHQLPLQLAELQQRTERATQIHRSIKPSHVEKLTIFSRASYTGLAKLFTPVAMEFFGEAYDFITKPDPYDALRRVLMQTMIDTYDRKG
jgi:hypothetical protein